MEKSYVINRIKELCNKKNDREIALDFFYNNRIFHAKYLFLGNDLYVTDTLNVIELKDLDMGVLSMIGFCNEAADKFLVYLSFYYVMYHS